MEFHIQDHIRTMFGPCCNKFWPCSTFRLGRALFFSSLNQFGPQNIFLGCCFLHSARAIFGQCFSRLALRLATALKFSSLGHSCIQNTAMEYIIFMTMQGHVWTLFDQLYFQTTQSFEILKSASIGSKGYIHGVSYCGTMSWPCLDHIQKLKQAELSPYLET